MTTKLTGLEWKAYLLDKSFWPDEDTYMDYSEVTVDGRDEQDMLHEEIEDKAVVVIYGGEVVSPNDEAFSTSLETHFRRWKKKQNTTTFLVTCTNDKAEQVKVAIKAAGGKII